MTDTSAMEVLAIGGGPANLSLAALADPVSDCRVTTVEARTSVSWHPGLLWDDSLLQVSGVKDLVSLVDPRSRFSFLNFLHEQGRLYRHLIASAGCVSRKEFDQYLTWAAELLGVCTDEAVESVEHDGTSFRIHARRGQRRADHLVIGIGQVPDVPDCARDVKSPRVWHASRHIGAGLPTSDQDVLLVGGGQSAGEIALDMLSGRAGLPRCLSWVTGSTGLAPLDNSPFANEWFNPRFVEYFRDLTAGQRASLLDRQRAADHGVSQGLLARVYRRLYELDYLSGTAFSHEILAGWRLAELTVDRDGCRAVVMDTVTGIVREIRCDAVVLATGYRPGTPAFMAPLHDRMPLDGDGYAVSGDYRVRWDGPDSNRIYLQNGALRSHGVADPNLGLAAWRSAVIINSLLDREHYALKGDDITMSLQSGTLSGAAGTAR